MVGDFNLDVSRFDDRNYSRAKLLRSHLDEMSATGLSFIGSSSPTYFSHGCYMAPGGAKIQCCSLIDHVYDVGLTSLWRTVKDFAATDHRPVKVLLLGLLGSRPTETFVRRNLKRLSSATLCSALDANRLGES